MTKLTDLVPIRTVVKRFQEAGVPISERTLRSFARKTGHYRQCGRALFFTTIDIEALLSAMAAEPAVDSGSTIGGRIRSPMTDKERRAFTDQLDPPKKSRKAIRRNVVAMRQD